MTVPNEAAPRATSRRAVLKAGATTAIGAGLAVPAAIARAAGEPIYIGIITELSTIDGAPIAKAARMAVDIVNAQGGALGRPFKLAIFDDHNSATDAVRAFQRLTSGNDKSVVVLASAVSEIMLALEPWAARLKVPLITPAAASDKIAGQVHEDYDRFKYVFQAWLNATLQAQGIVESARDVLVDKLHMKTAAIASEDAAWTGPLDAAYMKSLPKIGLEVVDHIRFSPNTTDFAPVFNKVTAKKPNVIFTGMAHAGVVPVVQWEAQHVPAALYGANFQASSSTFWKATHGACAGVCANSCAGPDAAITPKTLPFLKAYGGLPPNGGFCTYDMIFILKEAFERAKSTAADDLVTALEATDYEGTIGRFKFYGRDHPFTHGLEYGAGLVRGVTLQWQDEKLRTIWPLDFATTKPAFPKFVRIPA